MALEDIAGNGEIQKTIAHVVGEALEPPAKEVGKQLATLIDLLFTPLLATKIYRDAWITDFKARIDHKFQQIPPDHVQAPPFNIVGSALEASKYNIAVEELREMFANLIAHACDREMEPAIHPSFIFILTQISSLEASILASFRPKKNIQLGIKVSINGRELPCLDDPCDSGVYAFPEQTYPIVNYYLARNDNRLLAQANVMIQDEQYSAEEVSAAVSNLVRLGLIEVSYQAHMADDTVYDPFYKNELYQTLFRDTNPGSEVFARSIRGNMIWGGQYNKVVVEKGIVRLTQLGYNFIRVCVLEKEVVNEGS